VSPPFDERNRPRLSPLGDQIKSAVYAEAPEGATGPALPGLWTIAQHASAGRLAVVGQSEMRETELSLNHQNALSVAAYSEQMRAQLFRVWLLSMQKYTAKSTKSNKFRSAPCHISCRRTAISG